MSKSLNPVCFAALLVSLLAVTIFVGCPAAEKPAVEEPAAEEPAAEEPAAEEPPIEEPAIEEPAIEQPAAKTPAEEIPPVELPPIETPEVKTEPVEVPAIEPPGVDAPAEKEPAAKAPTVKPIAADKVKLLVEVPAPNDTPDGMCLMPDGNIILAVPNVNSYLATEDKTQVNPPKLLKITPDNKIEHFMDFPMHPKTGKGFPFGICVGPQGDLYATDLQWFADPEKPGNNARVLRIPIKDGKPAGEPVVVIEGMVVANAVICHGGYLYVSDTSMIPDSKPLISGIFRVKLDKEGTKLTLPLKDDPQLVATIETHNPDVGFGADGLTFDSKGNLYCGNFADGTLHKIEFDAEGKVKSNTIFAKVPQMKSCDGIFCDLKTDKIYVADSLANAVQVVSPDGTVTTLVQDVESDGENGRLDQPCEVLIRGKELIISNFDMPVTGGVNTKFETPNTVSVFPLD